MITLGYIAIGLGVFFMVLYLMNKTV